MTLLVEQSVLTPVADSSPLSEIVHMRFDEGGLIFLLLYLRLTTVLADTLLKIDEYLLVMAGTVTTTTATTTTSLGT